MSNIVKPTTDLTHFWGGPPSEIVQIPTVSLGQGQSLKAVPGKYTYRNGPSMDKLERVKVIANVKTRVLYGAGQDSKSRCASDDFYTPSYDRVANPVSPNCLSCFAAKWGESEEKAALAEELGKKGANLYNPMCKETLNPLMVDGQGRLFFYRVQGTHLKVFSEKLFSKFQYDFAGTDPFLVSFTMGVERTMRGGNAIYSPTFSDFKVVEGEEEEFMRMMYARHAPQAQSYLTRELNKMEEEKDVTGTAAPF